MLKAWRIYYRGGRVFSSDDGDWADAPPDGVLAVVEIIGHRRTVRSGGDYYRLDRETGEVIVHETAAVLIRAIGRVDMSPVLEGWCTGPSEMARVFDRIKREHGV